MLTRSALASHVEQALLDRNAIDAQQFARAVIRLDQRANRVAIARGFDDARRGAVDSFLTARRGMRVAIDELGMEVSLRVAESIHTESSHKFGQADIALLAAGSGFRAERSWTDDRRRFALSLLVIE